jgi:DGQHR domain-containing protein
MSEQIMLNVIPFEQPIGEFLLSIMKVPDLINISRADPRKFDSVSMETVGGIQREPSRKRIKEIAEYAKTVDVAFPTPILLALDDGCYKLYDHQIRITGDQVADIVDGQHRILGLKEAGIQEEFMIPVVFLLGATEEQKALIFATINGKQTKVPASLIYELFGVTKSRSPYKTSHEIARALNSTPGSPWYKRLKMLGRKSAPGTPESLSQGTFVKWLLPCISKKPDAVRNQLKAGEEPTVENDCIFNKYFLAGKDSTILKILMNVFKAAQSIWPDEWSDPDSYVLTKTNGFTGIMKALPELVNKGTQQQDLSVEYFSRVFQAVNERMDRDSIQFTVTCFEPSSVGENKIRDMIRQAVEEL